MSSPAAAATSRTRDIFELVALVVAPTTAVTALLCYFGWVRENAVFAYFGVDTGLVGFSTQDYLLRSGGIAFRPVAISLLLVGGTLLFCVGLRQLLSGPMRAHVGKVLAGSVVSAIALIAYGLAVLTAVITVSSALLAACALGMGVLLAEVAATIAHRHQIYTGLSGQSVVLRRSLVAAFVLVAVFWGTTVYAQHLGNAVGEAVAKDPGLGRSVVVYSNQRLQLTGPGVQVVALDPQAAVFRFRYTGMRLLFHGNARWFLFPSGWTRGTNSTVTILPDSDETIRVDLIAPP